MTQRLLLKIISLFSIVSLLCVANAFANQYEYENTGNVIYLALSAPRCWGSGPEESIIKVNGVYGNYLSLTIQGGMGGWNDETGTPCIRPEFTEQGNENIEAEGLYEDPFLFVVVKEVNYQYKYPYYAYYNYYFVNKGLGKFDLVKYDWIGGPPIFNSILFGGGNYYDAGHEISYFLIESP